MVKGVTRQVVVVRGTDPKLFEQAIFILRQDAPAVTDEQLLKEAKLALRSQHSGRKRRRLYGPVWACGGALLTGIAWMISILL